MGGCWRHTYFVVEVFTECLPYLFSLSPSEYKREPQGESVHQVPVFAQHER